MAALTPEETDFAEIVRRSEGLRRTLDRLKAENQRADFAWYPYRTLTNLEHLDRLLTGERRRLLGLIGDRPVLDAGCADGDLSFWLESLGCQVQALDCYRTNYNRMVGIRTLKEALKSSIEIHEADLDAQFSLPSANYGLVLLLGVLYHLKNPFHVLETLAGAARYCLLNTMITSQAPAGWASLRRLPIAYLLDEKEANNDPSNYWVFSEAGLRRLLARTRWEICDWLVVRPKAGRGASFWDRRERAFCLVRSLVVEPGVTSRLLSGWHALEEWTWRWTERRFSAALRVPRRSATPTLALEFVLVESLLERLGPVTVSARLAGALLSPQTYDRPGEHVYRRQVPTAVLTEDEVVVEFELDKALPPDASDHRELGLIARSLQLQ